MHRFRVTSLLWVLCLPAGAQEVTGSIVGTVVDGSGAAIPGAIITVSATDRGLVIRNLTTGHEGEFVATLLPIGSYSLKAVKGGFRPLVQDAIQLHVNDKLTFRLEMEVGPVTESVTVDALANSVELQSPVVDGLISGTEVTELSLNNRNFLQLISLMPGVSVRAMLPRHLSSDRAPCAGMFRCSGI